MNEATHALILMWIIEKARRQAQHRPPPSLGKWTASFAGSFLGGAAFEAASLIKAAGID
jgi:hypothetical protein